jgi:HEAT repeat protein
VGYSRGDGGQREGCIDSLISDLADPALQSATRNRLAGMGPPAVPKLLRATRSHAAAARGGAADALGRIGARASAPADEEAADWKAVVCRLVDMLADPVAEVRLQAIVSLGNVGRDSCGARAALAALQGAGDQVQEEFVRMALQGMRR